MHNNKPSKKEDIFFRRIGDEMVLYNPEAKFVHIINSTAALSWELCDGSHSLDQIEDAVRAQFEAGIKNDIHKDIQEIVGTFKRLKLLKKNKGKSRADVK